jgi:hypothetical protein
MLHFDIRDAQHSIVYVCTILVLASACGYNISAKMHSTAYTCSITALTTTHCCNMRARISQYVTVCRYHVWLAKRQQVKHGD